MAKKRDDLQEFPTSSQMRFEEKYPVKDWLDGSIWEIEAGKDFEVKPATFYGNLKSYARKSGLVLKIRQVGENILVQKS